MSRPVVPSVVTGAPDLRDTKDVHRAAPPVPSEAIARVETDAATVEESVTR